jgi:hypothetical protein
MIGTNGTPEFPITAPLSFPTSIAESMWFIFAAIRWKPSLMATNGFPAFARIADQLAARPELTLTEVRERQAHLAFWDAPGETVDRFTG